MKYSSRDGTYFKVSLAGKQTFKPRLVSFILVNKTTYADCMFVLFWTVAGCPSFFLIDISLTMLVAI